MVYLANEPRSFSWFWDCTQVLHFELLLTVRAIPISSKGLLPTVVDIIVIWIKFPIPIHFSLLFLKCQCSLLPSPVWAHPIYLIHGPNIPSSCTVLFFTASDFTFTTRYIHTWALFALWLSLFTLSGAVSLLFPSRVLDTYWPAGMVPILQFHIFLPFFHPVDGVLKARILKWFVILFSSGPCFVSCRGMNQQVACLLVRGTGSSSPGRHGVLT